MRNIFHKLKRTCAKCGGPRTSSDVYCRRCRAAYMREYWKISVNRREVATHRALKEAFSKGHDNASD